MRQTGVCEQEPALRCANLLRVRTKPSLRILNRWTKNRMDARESTRLRGGRRGYRTGQLDQRPGLWPIRRAARQSQVRCAAAQCSFVARKENSVVATSDRVLRNTRPAL